jgi:hypothetical protein
MLKKKYNVENIYLNSTLVKNRSLFTLLFILYIVFLVLLYVFNPHKIISTYAGTTTLVAILLGCFLFIPFVFFTVNPETESTSPLLSIFQKGILFLMGLGISGLFIYFIVYLIGAFSSKFNVLSFLLNVFIVVIFLSIIYKLISSQFINQLHPALRLIIDTFLYIPCLFLNLIQFISAQTLKFKASNAQMTEINLQNQSTYFILILLLCVAFIAYFLLPFLKNIFVLQGGKQLLGEPAPINVFKTLANYQELNNNPSNYDITNPNTTPYNYSYAISCWIYLESKPPNTNSFYTKYTSLLNFGGKPDILYKANTNSLMVKVQEKSPSMDEKNTVIYKNKHFPLQKWNNVIINYSAGNLDVFLNSVLVKSAINIVPYMSYDTLDIGTQNGLYGGICNVVYYTQPMNMSQIYYSYLSLKGRNPPTTQKTDIKSQLWI